MKRKSLNNFAKVFAGHPVPDSATLPTLPYGEQLTALFYPPQTSARPGDPKGAPHLHAVMRNIDLLLSGQPATILADHASSHCPDELDSFKMSYSQIWHGIGKDAPTTALFPPDEHQAIKTFLRAAALY